MAKRNPHWSFHGHPRERAETRAKAEAYASDLRSKGFSLVRVVSHKTMGARGGPWYTVKWSVPKGNPRKVKGRSITLRNMALITIRKLPNGVVKITGRKMANRRRKR